MNNFGIMLYEDIRIKGKVWSSCVMVKIIGSLIGGSTIVHFPTRKERTKNEPSVFKNLIHMLLK